MFLREEGSRRKDDMVSCKNTKLKLRFGSVQVQTQFGPGPHRTLGSGAGPLNAWTGPEVQVQVR